MLEPFTVANGGGQLRHQAEPEGRRRKGRARARGQGQWGGVDEFIYSEIGDTET